MEYQAGNVFVRQMPFAKAGDVVEGHEHNFSHVTYCAKGALLIERLAADGSVERAIEKRASNGWNWVLIEAGVRHRITALEDDSMGHCIYSHRNAQAEVVLEWDGWSPAYR